MYKLFRIRKSIIAKYVGNYNTLKDLQVVYFFLKKFYCIFKKILLIVYRYRSLIGIGRYEKYNIGTLSVSADMKIAIIGDYRYQQIRKKPYCSYTATWWISKEKSTFFWISLLTLQFFYSFFKFSFMNDLALFNLKCQLTFTLWYFSWFGNV